MIGLDSNIIIRFLTRDDERQTRVAAALIAKRCSAEDPGHIGVIVLVEVAWTLRRSYGFTRSQIADAIESLLLAPEITVEREEHVIEALRYVRSRNIDLADVLIALDNIRAGCDETLTFDRIAAKAGVMTLAEGAS